MKNSCTKFIVCLKRRNQIETVAGHRDCRGNHRHYRRHGRRSGLRL
nr:MAG TPA: hypothetical protein [Caudoviricetes sp.]